MINKELINPKSIAIVGASRNLQKPGGRLVTNLVEGGFKGNIYPVNLKEDEISGCKVYHTVDELPITDMAILALPVGLCVEVFETLALKKSTKAFIIISAGFSEVGGEGKKYEQKIKKLADERGLSVIGPNCIGILNQNYKAIFVSPPPPIHEKGVDFVSASGALAVFVFEMAAQYGLKFSSVFTVGNSTVIGVEEVLEYWNNIYKKGKSSNTKIIYVEQIRKPDIFYKNIHELTSKGCRIIVLKPGESEAGARAALSHTGSIAGDAEAYKFLIRKAGAIQCYSREDLVYMANILSQQLPKGRNLAIITHAGGPAVMMTDELQKGGFIIPEFDKSNQDIILSKLHPGASAANPIDMMATANREQLQFAVNFCNNLKSIDGIIVIYGKTGMEDLFDTYRILCETIKNCKKPVYSVLPSIHSAAKEMEIFIQSGIPIYTDEVIFGRCLSKLYNMPELLSTPTYLYTSYQDKNISANVLPEEEVFQRMQWSGIPIPNYQIFRRSEKEDYSLNIKFPIVAKAMGILHKTEHNAVILNINSKKELKATINKLMAIKGTTGILVQEMVNGVELYLGGKRHDGIGFSVHVGIGGVFVELIRDISSTLAPVTFEEALNMLSKLKAQKLFTGYRNMKPVNKEMLAQLIVQFSYIFDKYKDIREIDLNPLIANEQNIVVVDSRIIIDSK